MGYIHWKPANWLNAHGMDKFFTMDQNGVLTVKDHGVFLIYAQVIMAFSSLEQFKNQLKSLGIPMKIS
jgi:hypothetical protein